MELKLLDELLSLLKEHGVHYFKSEQYEVTFRGSEDDSDFGVETDHELVWEGATIIE